VREPLDCGNTGFALVKAVAGDARNKLTACVAPDQAQAGAAVARLSGPREREEKTWDIRDVCAAVAGEGTG